MGEENEKDQKDKDFEGFTLDTKLLAKPRRCNYPHCSTYRSKEITDEVEHVNSRIFE